MQAPKALIIATTTGVLLATSIVLPAIASQPKGSIKKLVQNQTTNSKREDADSAAQALPVKSGDILKWTIEVTNGGDSPMETTRLSDTLPAGIELVRDPGMRQISENLDTIAPGKTNTKTFVVRVTSNKVDDVIENKSCFTSNGKNAQNGCDSAFVHVTAAATPAQPKAPAQPQQPSGGKKNEEKPPAAAPPAQQPQGSKEAPKKEEGKQQEQGKQPAEQKPEGKQPPAPAGKENLPSTGPATALAPTVAVTAGAAGYAGRLYLLKRRRK